MSNTLIELDYETLLELENRNLSYEEMIKTLGLKIGKSFLSQKFAKYGIHHKSKAERLEAQVLASDGSIRFLARKYKVSPNTIRKIQMKDRSKMTTLEITRTKINAIFEIKGHSNFAPYGKDIVCASISTLVIAMINICNFHNMVESYFVEDGMAKIVLKHRGKNQKQITHLFEEMFKDISYQYPRNFEVVYSSDKPLC